MGRTGTVFDAQSTANYLEEANKDYRGQRTWSNLYGSIDLARQQATSGLERDYSTAINEAYTAINNNNNAISGSNLGTGYKKRSRGR